MSKLTWQQRQDIAFRAYRPYDRKMAVDVPRLRNYLFPDTHGRIPLEENSSHSIEVFNTRKESLGIMWIKLLPSKSIGCNKTRGGRGHRMLIRCPECEYRLIPIGRLHQHYGYKHPSGQPEKHRLLK